MVSFSLDPLLFLLGLALGFGASWRYALARLRHQKSEAEQRALLEQQNLRAETTQSKRAAFQSVLETFADGALTLDEGGHILGYNRAFQQQLGFQGESWIGRSLLSLVHPQDVGEIQDFLHSLVAVSCDAGSNSPRCLVQLRFHTEKGEILWGQLSLSVLHEPDLHDSHRFLVLAILSDVTQLHQAQSTAARLQAGVHELYRVIVNHNADIESQMKSLLCLGCRLFDVSTGLIGRWNDDALEIMAAVSPDSQLRTGRIYPMSNEKTARKLELPAPLRSGKVWQQREAPCLIFTQNETFLASPIYVGGQLSGVLCFSSPVPRETPFEPEHTQFCQLMALWLGAEIERRQRQERRDYEQKTLRAANAQLVALATQDGLTGLKNRRAFDDELQKLFKNAQLGGAPFSLFLMDVDKFKPFNDTFGHPAGDEVLRRVARLLGSTLRENGFVARYGGEEFVVLLPNTRLDQARVVAERARCAIEAANWELRPITASFGVAAWQPHMEKPQRLLENADAALYKSKEHGRNRVSCS